MACEQLRDASGAPAAHARPGRAGALALAAIATTCSSVDVWLIMTAINPHLEALWTPAVTLQSLVAAAGYALVALLALKFPRLIRPVPFAAGSAVLILAGTLAWGWGMSAANAAVATVAVCLTHLGCSWPRILVGASLCALASKRDLVAAAVLGEGIGALVRCVLPGDAPFFAAIAAAALVELAMLAAGHAGAAPFLRRVLAGDAAPSELDTTNPGSFLSPSHRLFVLITFFEVIHGVALGETGSVALATNVAVLVGFIVCAAMLALRHVERCEDYLLYASALLMIGGAMLRPLTPLEGVASSALSLGGAAVSWVLIYVVYASVGMSNPAGALWALGAGYTMQAVGLEAGSVLGHLAVGSYGPLALLAPAESVANVVNVAVTVAFIGYLLVGLRDFSFSATFADIVPVAALKPLEDTDARIAQACDALAARHGLSERELDVMRLLARGKCGQQIQDELVVSRNTVKTHVRHIYRKLDVHSQQELVNLVGGEGASGR